MRTVTFTCDKCGKAICSENATKLNINLQRGKDSVEKTSHDFCSPCFLAMKKAWKAALSEKPVKKVPAKQLAKPDVSIDELASTQAPLLPQDMDTAKVPKKRGCKPKPVNPEDWLNRTEIVYGVIKAPEKAFILKLHVEEGLSADEIAAKIHRIPKGIKRAIGSAAKSGELDRLRSEFQKSNPPADDPNFIMTRLRRNSYLMPERTEIIDGEKYDVGSIMAFHNAGWKPSEIAKEKGYDEDVVRVIIEDHKA